MPLVDPFQATRSHHNKSGELDPRKAEEYNIGVKAMQMMSPQRLEGE